MKHSNLMPKRGFLTSLVDGSVISPEDADELITPSSGTASIVAIDEDSASDGVGNYDFSKVLGSASERQKLLQAINPLAAQAEVHEALTKHPRTTAVPQVAAHVKEGHKEHRKSAAQGSELNASGSVSSSRSEHTEAVPENMAQKSSASGTESAEVHEGVERLGLIDPAWRQQIEQNDALFLDLNQLEESQDLLLSNIIDAFENINGTRHRGALDALEDEFESLCDEEQMLSYEREDLRLRAEELADEWKGLREDEESLAEKLGAAMVKRAQLQSLLKHWQGNYGHSEDSPIEDKSRSVPAASALPHQESAQNSTAQDRTEFSFPAEPRSTVDPVSTCTVHKGPASFERLLEDPMRQTLEQLQKTRDICDQLLRTIVGKEPAGKLTCVPAANSAPARDSATGLPGSGANSPVEPIQNGGFYTKGPLQTSSSAYAPPQSSTASTSGSASVPGPWEQKSSSYPFSFVGPMASLGAGSACSGPLPSSAPLGAQPVPVGLERFARLVVGPSEPSLPTRFSGLSLDPPRVGTQSTTSQALPYAPLPYYPQGAMQPGSNSYVHMLHQGGAWQAQLDEMPLGRRYAGPSELGGPLGQSSQNSNHNHNMGAPATDAPIGSQSKQQNPTGPSRPIHSYYPAGFINPPIQPRRTYQLDYGGVYIPM